MDLAFNGIDVPDFTKFNSRVRDVDVQAAIFFNYEQETLVDDLSDSKTYELELTIEVVKKGKDEDSLRFELDATTLLIESQLLNNSFLNGKIHDSKVASTDFAFDGGENKGTSILSAKMNWVFLYDVAPIETDKSNSIKIILPKIKIAFKVLPQTLRPQPIIVSLKVIKARIKTSKSIVRPFPTVISLDPIRMIFKTHRSNLAVENVKISLLPIKTAIRVAPLVLRPSPVRVSLTPIPIIIKTAPTQLFTASPFTPLKIDEVIGWWDVGQGANLNGSSVYQLDDESANGNHFTESIPNKQPIYISNEGLPFLRFDSIRQRLVTVGGFIGGIKSQPTTIMLVAKKRSVSVRAIGYLFDGIPGADRSLFYASLAGFGIYAGKGPVFHAPVDTTKRIIVAIFNGSSSKIYFNGGIPTISDAGTLGLNGLTLCARYTDAVWGDYDIWEMTAHNKLFSFTELNQQGNYLADKHSLPWVNVI